MSRKNESHQQLIDRLKRERDSFAHSLQNSTVNFMEKVKELSAIKRIGDAMSQAPERRRICTALVDIIIDEINAENCSLWLLNPAGDTLVLTAAQGQTDTTTRYFPPGATDAHAIGLGEGGVGWVAKNGWPLLIKDVKKNRLFKTAATGMATPIQSLLCLPIRGKKNIIGALNMSHPDIAAFSRENRRALELITSQMSMALENLFMFEQVQHFNDQLEEAVTKRTEELRAEKLRAEEATELKDKFVSLVAHDLKSPFTSIISATKLMADELHETLSENHREMLAHVATTGESMIRMIDNLLDVSRLQSGAVRCHPVFVDGYEIVNRATAHVAGAAQKKGVKLLNEIPLGTRWFADAHLFVAVITNLISNAVKFCSAGDRVTIFVPSGPGSRLAVKDNGAGVNPAIVADLFRQEVKTSHPGTAGEQGTGLGLPYCHEIVSLHQGEIGYEPVEGGGSLFTVALPYHRPRLLVVDDEEEYRAIVRHTLEPLDVNLLEAKDGRAALEVIDAHSPHLVVIDLIMPEMDGFALLAALQTRPDDDRPPVIVMTSDPSQNSREKAFQMGADDFVTKPIDRKDFIPRVRRFIA